MRRAHRIEEDGEATFLVGGQALTLKRHFIEDVRAADLRERIRTLHRALLIMHSPTDNTVGGSVLVSQVDRRRGSAT